MVAGQPWRQAYAATRTAELMIFRNPGSDWAHPNNYVAAEDGGWLTEQIRGSGTGGASSSILEEGGANTGQRPS
jgi:hypothetical protein